MPDTYGNGGGGGVITTLTQVLGDKADIELENTLVAANQGKNFVASGKGRFVSRSNNLDSDGSSNFSIPADRVPEPGTQIDARLGPLADNGGLTMTHALLPDSPAVDAGTVTSGTDQRGVPRPQNGREAERAGPRCPFLRKH